MARAHCWWERKEYGSEYQAGTQGGLVNPRLNQENLGGLGPAMFGIAWCSCTAVPVFQVMESAAPFSRYFCPVFFFFFFLSKMAWSAFCVFTPQKSAWDIVCDIVWSTTCDLIGNSVPAAKDGTLWGGNGHHGTPVSNPHYGCHTAFFIGALHRARSVGSRTGFLGQIVQKSAPWPRLCLECPFCNPCCAEHEKGRCRGVMTIHLGDQDTS